MESQTDLRTQRQFKLAELKRLGYDPYPHKFSYTHTLGDVRKGFDGRSGPELEHHKETVSRLWVESCLCVLTERPGFMDLSDGENRLQVYVRRDFVGPENFELFQLFDLGDIVGAEGSLVSNEDQRAHGLRFAGVHLSKNILPLPEKWHGLTDVETRFRQRYVDLIVNPKARDVFVKRSRIVRQIRGFLDERGYLEVETPVLQDCCRRSAGPSLPDSSQCLGHRPLLEDRARTLLEETHRRGIPRVYELSRIFRNGRISVQHNPDFTMLEFYQAYSDYRDLMNLTEEMISQLAVTIAGSSQGRVSGRRDRFHSVAAPDAPRGDPKVLAVRRPARFGDGVEIIRKSCENRAVRPGFL